MVKLLKLFIIAILTPMAFIFTACSDNDDEPNNDNNSKINIAYENSSIGSENYAIVEARVSKLTEWGETHNVFLAYLGDINPDYMFQFCTNDELIKSKNIDVKSIFFFNFILSSDATYFAEDYSGIVAVTDVTDKQVTLNFNDFKFNRKTSPDNLQKITINGSITYIKE